LGSPVLFGMTTNVFCEVVFHFRGRFRCGARPVQFPHSYILRHCTRVRFHHSGRSHLRAISGARDTKCPFSKTFVKVAARQSALAVTMNASFSITMHELRNYPTCPFRSRHEKHVRAISYTIERNTISTNLGRMLSKDRSTATGWLPEGRIK